MNKNDGPGVERSGYVYLLRCKGTYKIGISADPERRRAEIAKAIPFEVELVFSVWSADARATEIQWHRRFASSRLRGEWFNLADDEVREFCKHVPTGLPEKACKRRHPANRDRFVTPDKRIPAYEAAVQAIDTLRKTKDGDECDRAYAEARCELSYDEWTARGVSPSDELCCVESLFGKRVKPEEFGSMPPGCDHSSLWEVDDEPFCIVSHCYGLTGDLVEQLAVFCDRWHLEMRIDAAGSWHFPGRTLRMVFWRRGERLPRSKDAYYL